MLRKNHSFQVSDTVYIDVGFGLKNHGPDSYRESTQLVPPKAEAESLFAHRVLRTGLASCSVADRVR